MFVKPVKIDNIVFSNSKDYHVDYIYSKYYKDNPEYIRMRNDVLNNIIVGTRIGSPIMISASIGDHNKFPFAVYIMVRFKLDSNEFDENDLYVVKRVNYDFPIGEYHRKAGMFLFYIFLNSGIVRRGWFIYGIDDINRILYGCDSRTVVFNDFYSILNRCDYMRKVRINDKVYMIVAKESYTLDDLRIDLGNVSNFDLIVKSLNIAIEELKSNAVIKLEVEK